ncbi:hypothetical protein CGZ80_01535 [Rhodopirellula sp. MGV]|nr:hypothetical protein CGZ80_01535 [Rhodopirellula sp. MGV]PNY37692.1 hypothetical protein C2E31_06500 [Rhodopirellula baltica]
MVFTHEVGHLIGGGISGATLVHYDLAPWRLPYSLHQPDPAPLLTLWGGPVFGIAGVGLIAMVVRHPSTRFIADFCLLANGTYLAVAWFTGERTLDTARLLNAGASPLSILLFCAATIPLGYVRFRQDCIDLFVVPNSEETMTSDHHLNQ